MMIDTKTLVSMTDANQNFSKVAKIVDEQGSAVIMKNNIPKYVVISFEKRESDDIAADDELMAISRNLIQKNREAYEVLAR